jgi:hypothetical protein
LLEEINIYNWWNEQPTECKKIIFVSKNVNLEPQAIITRE